MESGSIWANSYGNAASSHDDDFMDIDFFFPGELLNVLDMTGSCGEIDNIADLYFVRSSGYDCSVFSFDGGYVVKQVGFIQFRKILIQDFCILPYFCSDKDKFSVTKFEPVAYPIMT